ncbi:MAG: phytoene desaturase [Candidatus Hydrogenedentes bacterium]|nr:phytoene desaturase [Candidatus Hydrogenedentota bacterium]
MKHAVIIGGGLGGLGAALRLAARNWQVTVCEQGPALGGKMNSWKASGFTFDTGPSLITMPWIFRELFEVAGSRLEDHLELVLMRPLASMNYDDGMQFIYSSNLPDWLDTLRRIAPNDIDGFYRFMQLGARLWELSKETFLRRPISQPPDRRVLSALRHFPFRHAWGNYHNAVKAHFNSPHLQQLYDRYPTYVGSSPYECPATLLVIPYIEYAFGGWYVSGGLYRIVESLVQLLHKHGVELRTNAKVSHITHSARRATGVELDSGERIPADVVIMNGDAACADHLLGNSESPSVPPAARSLSGLVFLLGVRRSLPEIHHHSVFFSADYPREFRQLFNERRFPDDPTVYVSAPSRSDRSLVPGDGEALFVMANAPANDHDSWDSASLQDARSRVFNRLRKGGFPDIEDDIAVETAWTPRHIAHRYLMPGGAIYGTHSHGWRKAFFRPPNKDRNYAGLYYVGGSSHPGGGTPTVLQSARITCELIARHEGA